MSANVQLLAGNQNNVDNVPLEQGKVLFAVRPEETGAYTGYIYYDYFDPTFNHTVRVSMGNGNGGGGGILPTLKILDIAGNSGPTLALSNVSSAYLKLPEVIETHYFVAQEDFFTSHNLFTKEGTSRMYGNGFIISNPYFVTKQGWIRLLGEAASDNSILELAMGDSITDNNISNTIVARLYDKENNITKEAILLDGYGNAVFPENVTANLFIGNLQGNAETATRAEQDEMGFDIQSTYLAEIAEHLIDGENFIIKGISGAGEIKCTLPIPAANTVSAGIITTGEQTLTGKKILDNEGSLEITGIDAFNYSGIQHSDDPYDTPLWFSQAASRGTPVYDTLFTYNANDNLLKVDNISGGYEIFPNFFGTNIQGIITNAKNDELDNNIIQHYIASLKDSLNIIYQSDKGINYTIGGFNTVGGEISSLQLPNADEETAGLITNSVQYLKGFKSLNGYLFFPNYCMGEDLIINATSENAYDTHPTGIRGQMSDEGSWMISGRENTSGVGFLEIGVGKTGKEPIYFTQYGASDYRVLLKRILTLMDENGGTVMHHLTITDDYDVREASTDFGLKVNQESLFLNHVYTSKSIRLGSDESKISLFYIYPDETLGWQTTKYRDNPYYAYLESMLIQNGFEVKSGKTVLGDILITRDIIPDDNYTYRIGRGTPNDPTDIYYLESYIKDMYSNKLIIQGPVEQSKVTTDTFNPKIVFQNNTNGTISHPIQLIYSDYLFNGSYDTLNGLRLTGEHVRSYLDIDGTIYSRFNDENYVRNYSDDLKSGQLITACGTENSGLLIHTYVDTDNAYQLLQRKATENYVQTSVTYDSNILESIYKSGSNQSSMFKSTVTPGSSVVRFGTGNNSFFEFKSDIAPSESITIKTNNNIYTTWESNYDKGFNIYSRFSASNHLTAYKDLSYGLYFQTQYDNDSFIEQYIKNNHYEFIGQAASNILIKQHASVTTGVYQQMLGAIGKWTSIEMHNGSGSWVIGTKSTTDYTTGNLSAGSLQFRKDNDDLKKVAFAYNDDVGIELYGDYPYIDFHWMSTNTDYTSRIRSMNPIYSDIIGVLETNTQFVFSPDVEASALISGSGTILIGNHEGKHLALSSNRIVAKTDKFSTADIYINPEGGRIYTGDGGLEINSKKNKDYMFSVTGSSLFTGDILTVGNYVIQGNVSISDYLTVGNYLTVDNYLTVAKDTTIGGQLTVGKGASFGGDLLPKFNNEYSIGSSSLFWKNMYVKNIESEWIRGYLDGIARESEIAYALTKTLKLILNGNNYIFDGTNDISVRWYAPTYQGSDGQVIFWDNNKAAWLDPEWVFELEQGTEGKYLPLAGGTMRGALNFKSGVGNYVGIGSIIGDDSTPGQFWIQGINAETTLALASSTGAEYSYTIRLTNDDRNHPNTLNANAEICVISQRDPNSQGAFRMVGRDYGAYWKMDDVHNKVSLLITDYGNPFGGSNGLQPFWVDVTDGICHADEGLYGGLWNDYAEYRESNELEPGRCVYEVGDDSLSRTTKRLMAGCNIVSDTFGFAQGETDKAKTPIAAAGRVLAYPYEDRNSFEPGDAVCSGPNGTVSKMTREEIREWPDRIVGTVSCVPNYEYWGKNDEVIVNGRIWVKVK